MSDWSSDVCASYLTSHHVADGIDARGHAGRAHGRHHRLGAGLVLRAEKDAGELLLMLAVAGPAVDHRLDPGAGAGERFAGEAHGRISFRRSSAIVSISASAVANSRSALLSRRRSKAARISALLDRKSTRLNSSH